MSLFLLAAAAAVAAPAPKVTLPPPACAGRSGVSPHIIVQGGAPVRGGDYTARNSAANPGGMGGGGDPRAIGPKQDDPVGGGGRGSTALSAGKGGDPRTIGPKQDDPVQPHPGVCSAPAAAG